MCYIAYIFDVNLTENAYGYLATLMTILIYYYYGDRIRIFLNSLINKIFGNEYSESQKKIIDDKLKPEQNRKKLLLLLLIYIVIKIAYFANIHSVLKYEFVNEAFLTFVIFDTLIGGNNQNRNFIKNTFLEFKDKYFLNK